MDDEYSFDFDSPESWADYDLTYNPDTHIATGTEDDPYSGYIFEGPVQYRPVEITDPEATGYRQFVDPEGQSYLKGPLANQLRAAAIPHNDPYAESASRAAPSIPRLSGGLTATSSVVRVVQRVLIRRGVVLSAGAP